ncbi:NAD(P)-dependent oxidoreductase [Bradyrhizobium sp. CB82]|uniref:NAD-dependent epimerase/dehydratase family protein n=1 Tax=Bradyrhizobium sp. CB82 TaxID=3039159 RepID=UPI0024B0A15E|nr:NAD-dependent epimerase/dehydratase family protein [Bradyrhizobium sp. CB82]WFU38851.1 NAD(P)-dependent oxidoreductase [Bradyrhizobium sp. CB82]
MRLMQGSALIGHTGFVGSNLARDRRFGTLANSKTIGDLIGRRFETIVCAGVSATKWLANRDPEADRLGIERLKTVLETLTAEEFILISTIDVYPDPSQPLNEDATINNVPSHAYGCHRLELENWVSSRFEKTRIVRLPALFGPGLKKNVIFDLLHDNQTNNINPASSFQWYSLMRLADDLDLIRSQNLSLVNLFPEPIATADILDAFFPNSHPGAPVLPAPNYCLTTRYSKLFGGPHNFVCSRISVLGQLADFVANERRNKT